MIFRQSAVEELSRDRVVERSETVDRDIHALLLGSGVFGFSTDATGMQGLNSRLPQYRDCASFEHRPFLIEKNLHVYVDQAISCHYKPEVVGPSLGSIDASLLPSGWLDYDLIIDGSSYTAADIAAEGHDWMRSFSPLSGTATLSYAIDGVLVELRYGIAVGASEVDYHLSVATNDRRPRRLGIRVRFETTLRDGRPIASGAVDTIGDDYVHRSLLVNDTTAGCAVLEEIRLGNAVCAGPHAVYSTVGDTMSALVVLETAHLELPLRIVCGSNRNGTESAAFAQERAAALAVEGSTATFGRIEHSWKCYAASAADYRMGDPEKEFIHRQSLYVLRAGFGWHSGIPIGTLWTQKFYGATFWDSYFGAEGMIRANRTDEVRSFCDWVVRTAQPVGRPHPWMSYYNGASATNPEVDRAYQSCLAFSGIPIRLYESTGDSADLVKRAYPYLKLIAAYFLDEGVISRDADSVWRLHGETAHDVGDEHLDAAKQNTMLLWIVVSLAKFAEYADLLGVADETPEHYAACREMADYYRRNPIRLDRSAMWYGWIPYLTGGDVFADFAVWRDEVVEHTEAKGKIGTYSGMPWGNCTQAASYLETGQPDLALEYIDGAMKFITGPGYLTEGPYEFQVGGHAPYFPSCGAYLSALALQFVRGSLWSDSVDICVTLPRFYRYRRVSFRNVRSENGALVEGSWTPYRLDITLDLVRPLTVRLRIPSRMAGEPMVVRVNGRPADAESGTDETVAVSLPVGRHTVAIRRDLESVFPLLLVEPHDIGSELASLLEEEAGGDMRCRWLRDLDALPHVLSHARVVVVPGNFVALPLDIVAAFESFARQGGTLITTFHGGAQTIDSAMARLSGVGADISEDTRWKVASQPRTMALTKEGRSRLPRVAPTFSFPVAQRFVAGEGCIAEVLAVDAETGGPFVTRRAIGEGAVYWIGAGPAQMDAPPEAAGFGQVRRIFVYGETRAMRADPKWIRDSSFRAMVASILEDAHKERV